MYPITPFVSALLVEYTEILHHMSSGNVPLEQMTRLAVRGVEIEGLVKTAAGTTGKKALSGIYDAIVLHKHWQ